MRNRFANIGSKILKTVVARGAKTVLLTGKLLSHDFAASPTSEVRHAALH